MVSAPTTTHIPDVPSTYSARTAGDDLRKLAFQVDVYVSEKTLEHNNKNIGQDCVLHMNNTNQTSCEKYDDDVQETKTQTFSRTSLWNLFTCLY